MKQRIFRIFPCLLLLLSLCLGCFAADVDSGTTLCLSRNDFENPEDLSGICILSLPDSSQGTVLLGSRVLCPGDILPASDLENLSFRPVSTERDKAASIRYLPVFGDSVAEECTMTISIHGKQDKAPIAEDDAVETYRNIPLVGKLKVNDPEAQAMTYSITRQPRRGTVELGSDGSFTYTPKNNKIGADSFVYTATDPAGNVSREATVTIRVLRPTDARLYSDVTDTACRFYAEWMKNSGIFSGEAVGGKLCFSPSEPVSRGQFLVMAVKALGLPVEEYDRYSGYQELYPTWFADYMPSVLRCGLLSGLTQEETDDVMSPISGGEAALILQNALQLEKRSEALTHVDAVSTSAEGEDDWAAEAISVMAEYGLNFEDGMLTRADAAKLLYEAASLRDTAPGMARYK